MNNLFFIERAKVVKAYPFETGTNQNGPWASRIVVVEWEIPSADPAAQPTKCKAAVTFGSDLALYARDNIKEGNPFNGTPDQYLQLQLRPWGGCKEVDRRNGQPGKAVFAENTLWVDRVTIVM